MAFKRKKKYEGLSFERLSQIIHRYLNDDGLTLDLTGYRDMLQRYFRVQDHDLLEIHETMIDCNLWYNYLSSVEALMAYKKEEWTLEADWLYAHEVMAEPSEELESRIQNAKERAKHYGMFEKQIESQRKFFWKASDHCQELYRRGISSMARS